MMNRRAVFVVFLVSGASALLYQVVWLRLAEAHFGVITPVLSVVLSVFMLGLGLGSWLAGRWAEQRDVADKVLRWYAACEAVIGVGAFMVPLLYGAADHLLLAAGAAGSFLYLFLSAIAIAVTTLPWCLAMGATTPLMLAYLNKTSDEKGAGFSYLYLANTLGAVIGTLASAFVFIEVFGFRGTLIIGALGNFGIAAFAFWSVVLHGEPPAAAVAQAPQRAEPAAPQPLNPILFISGFTSMSIEVIFVRMFTPIVGTTTYAFALILALYLVSITLGSRLYRSMTREDRTLDLGLVVFAAITTCVTPILFNEPRLHTNYLGILLSAMPFFFITGLLTPRLVDQISAGDPEIAGRAYAVNLIGCILGPLAAGYLLLPFMSAKAALILMALAFFIISWRARALPVMPFLKSLIALAVFTIVLGAFGRTYETRRRSALVRRDYAATVQAGMTKTRDNKFLEVNGIGMTSLVAETKLMAHMPCAFRSSPPKKALDICLGMGTTFRSLASWNCDVTAVELIPSVAKSFSYFYPDADAILQRPGVKIVVDDGRRFLRRTDDTFDVVAIDPPPPVQAAGSSLLYSVEFYRLIKRRLSPDGILQHWLPEADDPTVRAVTEALRRSFKYVKVFPWRDSHRRFYLASDAPLPDLDAVECLTRMPATARRDLREMGNPMKLVSDFVANEMDAPASGNPLSDDQPINEYYLLRRLFHFRPHAGRTPGRLRTQQLEEIEELKEQREREEQQPKDRPDGSGLDKDSSEGVEG